MKDDDLMPIGIHRDKQMKDVPHGYWEWFIIHVQRNFHNYKIHDYIKEKYGIEQVNTRTEEV
jgi:hypothetical protein